MADVKALSILSELIKDFKKIQDPPENIDALESYNKSVKKVVDGAISTITKVKSYIEQVEKKIKELRNIQGTLVKHNQDAIENILGNLKPQATLKSVPRGMPFLAQKGTTARRDLALPEIRLVHELNSAEKINEDRPNKFMKGKEISERESAFLQVELAHGLQKILQERMDDRLNDLIKETETVCAKLKDGMVVNFSDIEKLKGCLQSWKNAKQYSFEEEKRKRLEKEEKNRNQEEERKKRKKKLTEEKEKKRRR